MVENEITMRITNMNIEVKYLYELNLTKNDLKMKSLSTQVNSHKILIS